MQKHESDGQMRTAYLCPPLLQTFKGNLGWEYWVQLEQQQGGSIGNLGEGKIEVFPATLWTKLPGDVRFLHPTDVGGCDRPVP